LDHQFSDIKRYLRAEKYLLGLSQDFEIPMGVLDSIIWTLVRELKKSRRERGCEMQYALRLEG